MVVTHAQLCLLTMTCISQRLTCLFVVTLREVSDKFFETGLCLGQYRQYTEYVYPIQF